MADNAQGPDRPVERVMPDHAIARGDVGAAARLMSDLDDEVPAARAQLRQLFPLTGRAHVIGVTGAPGSGKSTLVDQLVGAFRQRGDTVGVVAIDPSSPFGGGAILGDRLRMQRHSVDEGVFVRSLASRGYLGGLSRSTGDIIDVMDVMGKTVIIVETVGVGQDEIDIMRFADTVLVVQVPGLGDDVQAIKAGLLEIASIFVVNKSDLDGADQVVRDLESMLSTKTLRPGIATPGIVKVQATRGRGIAELVEAVDRHRSDSHGSDGMQTRHRRLEHRFYECLREALFAEACRRFKGSAAAERILAELRDRRIDPSSAATAAIEQIVGWAS